MTYEQATEWLFNQFPSYQQIGQGAYKPGLDNILELCMQLGNPHDKLKFIHVAGTNGKGSVSNMLASILTESGEKVGLFTSPHLFDFNERIRINGIPIEQQFVIKFCEKVQSFKYENLSFFELTWGMALSYFQEKNCSIAVVETGLGGRLDATNIITPLLSIITNIGLDHTALLGNTRQQIAFEKAGIIKPGIPILIGENDIETFPVFEKIAREKKSKLSIAPPLSHFPTTIIGYQKENFSIVKEACNLLNGTLKISKYSITKGLANLKKNTGFFGRLEIISKSPLIIADCAHNTEGIKVLFESINPLIKGNLHCIYGTSADKDVAKIAYLFPQNAQFYFTCFSNQRSMKLGQLQEMFGNTFENAHFFENPIAALKSAQESVSKEDTILIFGSFFLIHDFFEYFFQK